MKLFTVENNEFNRSFIKTLQKNIRNTPKKLVLRGRGTRFVGGKHYHRDIPVSVSTHIAVYLENRDTTKFVKVIDLNDERGFRYLCVPTKYHSRYEELTKAVSGK